MNSHVSEEEKRRRGASRDALRKLVADFQATEAGMIEAAERAVVAAIRQNYPIVAGCAIQSGNMSGRITLELVFDLTPTGKAVEVHATVQPPPIRSSIREAATS